MNRKKLLDALDFAIVLQASQALSKELVIEHLLTRLMQFAMENVDAQRGILLLKKEGRWLLEVEKIKGCTEVSLSQSIALDDSDQVNFPLPLVLLHRVADTKKCIVVHDVLNEKLLTNDSYIQKARPCSLVMAPILHHDEMMGILYLENNVLLHAFTDNQLEVLRLLALQAAISIENARLYAGMAARLAACTAELTAISLRDGLTGVANRRAFGERLDEELARSRRNGHTLSLLMVDIDHFQHINEAYGYPAGDACLRLMALALSAECRRAGDFVARYDSNVFALLLPDTDLEHAVQSAELVRGAVQKVVLEAGDIRYPITVSIGITDAKSALLVDAASLVAAAYRRLHVAKTGGRNRVVDT